MVIFIIYGGGVYIIFAEGGGVWCSEQTRPSRNDDPKHEIFRSNLIPEEHQKRNQNR